MKLSATDRLFVLTGAGVSAESGLATFRGDGGLWRTYRAEEVANIAAWHRDPQLVWEFYSMRRRKALAAKPNPAHVALAEIEAQLGERFFLCTQNVDSLHEQAGSLRVQHIHGELMKTKCDSCARTPFADESTHDEGVTLPQCDCGGTLRVSVVWFGEMVSGMERVLQELQRCTAFVAIGTSGVVEPVASFVRALPHRNTLYIGPEEPANADAFSEFMLGPAAEMVPRFAASLFSPQRREGAQR
jgi:NAD-dependent deacetylase